MVTIPKALSSLVIGLSFTATASHAETYSLLKDTRAKIVFPTYSPSEKKVLIEQALVLARDLYVHRDLKVAAFGPQVDPVPRIEALLDVADGLSPKALNDALSQIFLDQRDLHFNFYYPSPVSCYAAFLPVSFNEVLLTDTNSAVVVATTDTASGLTIAGADQVQKGDRLIAYDAQNVEAALQSVGRYGAGANPGAYRARSVQQLSSRNFMSKPILDRDAVTLILERPNGERYVFEAPWILRNTCAATVTDAGGASSRGKSKTWQLKTLKPRFDQGSDPDEILFNDFFQRYAPILKHGKAPIAPWVGPLTTTAEPILKYATLQATTARLGYIRLDSFQPSKLSADETVVEIKKIIEQKFQGLDGIVVDVRDNGGGTISMGESMVQLFSAKDIKPSSFRMLANETNEHYLSFSRANLETLNSVRDARSAGLKYNSPVQLTSTKLANRLGQSWFKPVVVLTNGNCYSTCDMFTANMQDQDAAVIVGEHETTGAGGANVVEHSSFLKDSEGDADSSFVKLPYGADMRVAWRQNIRAGKHNGELLENVGARSDVIMPRTLADLLQNDAFLVEKLAKIVHDKAKEFSGLSHFAVGQPFGANLSDVSWSESVVRTDSIEIIRDGSLVKRQSVTASDKPQDVTLTLPGSSQRWSNMQVDVLGYYKGQRTWKVRKYLRWVGDYAPLAAGSTRSWNFDASASPDFILENFESLASEGWQWLDGKMVIGTNAKYVDNVTSRLYLPLSLTQSQASTLSFDVDLKTEQDYDFVSVYARVPGSSQVIELWKKSGEFKDHVTVDLAPLKGLEKADLVFEFASDAGVVDRGVTLDNVEIKTP